MGVFTTIATMAIAAAAAIQQGQAAKKQANYQAKVYDQQAARALADAGVASEDFARKESAAMATRHASLGGSGVDAGSGSPLLVSEDFAGEAELGRLRILNGGQVQASRLEASAGLQRMAGRQAVTGSYFQAAAGAARSGSLLMGGGSGSSGWGTTSNPGPAPGYASPNASFEYQGSIR